MPAQPAVGTARHQSKAPSADRAARPLPFACPGLPPRCLSRASASSAALSFAASPLATLVTNYIKLAELLRRHAGAAAAVSASGGAVLDGGPAADAGAPRRSSDAGRGPRCSGDAGGGLRHARPLSPRAGVPGAAAAHLTPRGSLAGGELAAPALEDLLAAMTRLEEVWGRCGVCCVMGRCECGIGGRQLAGLSGNGSASAPQDS
jgi:hypothetical protein